MRKAFRYVTVWLHIFFLNVWQKDEYYCGPNGRHTFKGAAFIAHVVASSCADIVK